MSSVGFSPHMEPRPILNPIPSNLRSEAKKAAKILREFTQISNRTGPDKLIPAHIIAKAEGLAIISVIKAGFMVTARGGSGVVIARLADRRWSAPSAIGIAGLGGGFELGVEVSQTEISPLGVDGEWSLKAVYCVQVSDLVIILNQRRAIEAFTKGGNLTLGGNCTVAVGPMGRNLEADIALRSTAAVFTYCRSRGLFAGISLEGSYLIERKDTNRKYAEPPLEAPACFRHNVTFYCQDIRASCILNGDVEPPTDFYDLYHILDVYTEAYTSDWTSKNLRGTVLVLLVLPVPFSVPPSRPPAPSQKKTQSSYRQSADSERKDRLYPSVSVYKSDTSTQFASRDPPRYDQFDPEPPSYDEGMSSASGGGATGSLVVTATHPFTGQQPGDLSFVPGDRITVITKTDSQYDWWEGQLDDGRVGIFPANFVSY
ncbi:hypothetical protein CCH79_00017276 [Gambusia affinis]|uniref:SH3 domain-containing YSC84-like protein 1 n=1 Tax=Gambusia affinis TaxID=33528 RepID=A0A315X091_GAMAF|nr:hypothetical protein CCH79_00017276 [Gambusia affinis]